MFFRARAAALLALPAALAGCALFPHRVGLAYSPSKNVERRSRQTPLGLLPFVDRRRDARNLGRAPVAWGLGAIPIQARGNLADWTRAAAGAELASAGYVTTGGDWKIGGALKEISCGSGKRTICTVKLEAWVLMKDGWQALKSEYAGEGVRPPLFGEDPYEISLEEALRDALAAFRRDVERLVP